MAGEIQIDLGATGRTCYFVVRDRTARIWNGSGPGAFEAYDTTHYAGYPVSYTEQGVASAFYVGTFPAAIAPGIYSVSSKVQVGGSPAESDRTVGGQDYQWNGSATVPLTDLANSGQLGQFFPQNLARGRAISNFLFDLVSDTDGKTPFVSGTVSGQVVRDNGVFGPLQSGLVTEVGNGVYRVNLTSGDLLANTAFLFFDAADPSGGRASRRRFFFALQRTSGN